MEVARLANHGALRSDEDMDDCIQGTLPNDTALESWQQGTRSGSLSPCVQVRYL